jgi:hypothetical protein
MPILQRPQQTGTTNVVQIGAGNAATSATHIAQVTDRLGGSVAALGKEYLQKSQQALSTAVYDLHMQKATEEFNQLSQERMSKTVDDEGNPNFATLPQDIERIGNEVMMKRLGTMFDPNASSQFTRDFRNFASSQSVKAAGVARQQELDYSRAQVNSTMSASINKALTLNIAEADTVLIDMKRSLDSYLASGTISKQEYDTYLDSTRATVYKAKWGELIAQDADTAVEQLSQEQALGLTEVERRQMLTQAHAKVEDNTRLNERILRENEAKVNQQQQATYEELKTSILSGKAGEADIWAAFNNGAIDQKLLNTGIQFARTEAKRQGEVVNTQANIAQQVKDGMPVTASSKDVDLFVNTKIQQLQEKMQKELTLEEKTYVASDIRAPVNAITKPIEHGALFGNVEETSSAYRAWSFAQQKNPEMVSTLSNHAVSNMAMIDSLVSASNLPVNKAVEAVKKIVDSRTPEKIQELSVKFKDDYDLKDMTSEANVISGEALPRLLDPFGFTREVLATGEATKLMNLYRTMYTLTEGDKDATRAAVKAKVATTLGKTELGGEERLMFLAPEKMFPMLTSVQLDEIMRSDMRLSPDEKVVLEVDQSSDKVPGVVSYKVSRFDKDGIPLPSERWVMDNETAKVYLETQKEAVDIDALKNEREVAKIISNIGQGIKGFK